MNKTAMLEVLLFVAGEEGLTIRDLASLMSISPQATQQQIDKLKEKYENDEESALTIIETASRYRLTSKDIFKELLQHYAKTPINQSLSKAALEVLSIIAYKQPLTRIEVDNIRGVNSQGAITTLLTFDLIKVIGKKEVIGSPNLYATTDFFLDYLGINSLEELPQVDESKLDIEEVSLFDDGNLTIEELSEDI
ncbi:SMC-Scp complex subunit ScpB [Floricoccus penangensis]|uniref:SMC-Scp complex subunit ScpB n=1 Tax=Floricoccus penangensis TaxID=1859475 RepID=UPI00203EF159|nr:SMC-Scp complex subunit ScpB [Floricoccus penangensis]URZ88223.1 segregation/condensation protein B [Floricoccus penangensis]